MVLQQSNQVFYNVRKQINLIIIFFPFTVLFYVSDVLVKIVPYPSALKSPEVSSYPKLDPNCSPFNTLEIFRKRALFCFFESITTCPVPFDLGPPAAKDTKFLRSG